MFYTECMSCGLGDQLDTPDKEGRSVEKLTLSDGPVDTSVGEFYQLLVNPELSSLWAEPFRRQVGLDSFRKAAEASCGCVHHQELSRQRQTLGV